MKITVWRIIREEYAHEAYSGEGARLYGGRFNSPGRPVVYTSGSLSLATLELLANLDDYDADLLGDSAVVPATVPLELSEELPHHELPEDWLEFPHPPSTRRIGDDWLEEGRSLILSVPSAVLPKERSYLINPAHPDFGEVTTGELEPLEVDPRILGRGSA